MARPPAVPETRVRSESARPEGKGPFARRWIELQQSSACLPRPAFTAASLSKQDTPAAARGRRGAAADAVTVVDGIRVGESAKHGVRRARQGSDEEDGASLPHPPFGPASAATARGRRGHRPPGRAHSVPRRPGPPARTLPSTQGSP